MKTYIVASVRTIKILEFIRVEAESAEKAALSTRIGVTLESEQFSDTYRVPYPGVIAEDEVDMEMWKNAIRYHAEETA